MKKRSQASTMDYKQRYDLIRHPERIRSSDVIEGVFDDVLFFDSPDPSLLAAKGTINGISCIILGQEKKRKGRQNQASGMITAKGYAFTLEMLDEAEANNMPVISFIDTFGGDSSMQSELNGQSFLISDSITRYCDIKTPTISFVLGEGGSGGALALQVADRGFMLENALYSVIAPESCSRIIFHKRLAAGEDIEETLQDALSVLRPGAEHIKEIGMIDEILPEPEKGAHTDYDHSIETIKKALTETLDEFTQVQKGKRIIKKGLMKKLLRERREKVLNYGRFRDSKWILSKRKTKRKNHDDLKPIDVEREDFHTLFQIRAHLEQEGIEDSELFNCEREWDPDTNKFRVAGGCGFVSFKDYVDNYYACPKCGKGEYLSVEEQIDKISDEDSFRELEGNLTIKKLINSDRYYHGKYKELLERLEGTTFSKEALVTGTARINGRNVVLAISDLKFIGGSFGAVFGEKFRRAVNFAVKKKYPFISLNSSGGARMNEGPMALAQMAKMNMALLELKKAGVLYQSVIIGPTTGGAYASYVTQGDIMIGEKGALVEFAGPRVVMGAGFDVDREIVSTEKLYETRKIQHLVHRKELKDILSYYTDLFYDIKYPRRRRSRGRIRDFRESLDLTTA